MNEMNEMNQNEPKWTEKSGKDSKKIVRDSER